MTIPACAETHSATLPASLWVASENASGSDLPEMSSMPECSGAGVCHVREDLALGPFVRHQASGRGSAQNSSAGTSLAAQHNILAQNATLGKAPKARLRRNTKPQREGFRCAVRGLPRCGNDRLHACTPGAPFAFGAEIVWRAP